MRGFFTRLQPEFTRILLIESGGRSLLNSYLPALQRAHGSGVIVDLVTCFAGLPEGFQDAGTVYRVGNFTSPDARTALVAELKANGYAAAGMICSSEAIMTKWKWMLATRLPVKIFVINENADVFWLDWAHAAVIRHFVLFRAGLTGAGAVPTIARLLLLPFTLAFLIAYAAWEHGKRRARILIV
ncbi:MAG: hypothetical protein ABI823_15160 [Bryobacteraceae bacterium]